MSFQFPQVIRAEGSIWHLIYDPDSPNNLLPSFQDAKVQNIFGQWVQVPDGMGKMQKLYMSVVDLVFPSVNTPTYRKPSQYVRGFSLSPHEVDPSQANPQGMAIYTKELAPPLNVAQEFLNAVLGTSLTQQENQNVDKDWTKKLPSNIGSKDEFQGKPLVVGGESK